MNKFKKSCLAASLFSVLPTHMCNAWTMHACQNIIRVGVGVSALISMSLHISYALKYIDIVIKKEHFDSPLPHILNACFAIYDFFAIEWAVLNESQPIGKNPLSNLVGVIIVAGSIGWRYLKWKSSTTKNQINETGTNQKEQQKQGNETRINQGKQQTQGNKTIRGNINQPVTSPTTINKEKQLSLTIIFFDELKSIISNICTIFYICDLSKIFSIWYYGFDLFGLDLFKIIADIAEPILRIPVDTTQKKTPKLSNHHVRKM